MFAAPHPHITVDAFFQLACEHHGVPILIIDSVTGDIIKANFEAGTLYGYACSELESMNLADIIPSRPRSRLVVGEKQTILHRRADNSSRMVKMSSQPMALADGDVFFCVLLDVTDLVSAEREKEELEHLRRHMEIIADERTRQLNEVMEELAQETVRRQQIENTVIAFRENLENQERGRVARDIHDGIGQTLQAIKLQLKMQQARCKGKDACDGHALDGIIREITEASTELREVILALRPIFLEETSLDDAVRSLCERTAKRTNLNVRAECHGVYRGLGQAFKLSIFRICQEALTNIVKHSEASSAQIRLEREMKRLRLVIRDDGKGGVVSPSVISREGSGLTIMRERVELLNGTFFIISPPGMGTIIDVEVPLT